MELALLFAAGVSGKRLTRSTAHQNFRVIHWKEGRNFETGKLRNIFFNKQASIIFLVWITTSWVDVYACANGDALFLQTVGQSAHATEHVNRRN